MSILNAMRISRAPLAALTAIGVVWGGVAGFMPDIKAAVGASDAELGSALVMSAFGSIVSMYLAPRVGAALGRIALPLFGAVLCLAFFYPLLASNVASLGLAMFCIGASVAMLDITANVRISALENRHGLHLMNVNHAMFSVAFALTALVAALARKAGAGLAEVFPLLALICLGLAAAMWEGRGRLSPPEPDENDTRSRATPWRAILLTALVLFAGFVGENATEAWSALHIERTLGGAAGEGSFGPFMLGLTMAFGRFSGQFLADRMGEVRLILWSAALGMVGALVIAAAPTQAIVLIGVAILGLGMAAIVPTANSILGKLVREEQRSHALSRAWMAGMLGFFLGPAMMGGLAELFGLRISFAAVALVVAAIIPAVLALGRRGKGEVSRMQP
ncbi:MAG: MFS transporter [Paracoccaceae bacterium]